MINASITRKSFTVFCSMFLFSIAILSCGEKDETPKPQLIPIYSMFRLFQVNNGDTLVTGWGYLDQTVSNNVKITIKLDAPFRKDNGEYNINLYQKTGLTSIEHKSIVGSMPANSASWQSEMLKPKNSSQLYTFDQLHVKDTYLVIIASGSNEIARGQLEWAWE